MHRKTRSVLLIFEDQVTVYSQESLFHCSNAHRQIAGEYNRRASPSCRVDTPYD